MDLWIAYKLCYLDLLHWVHSLHLVYLYYTTYGKIHNEIAEFGRPDAVKCTNKER